MALVHKPPLVDEVEARLGAAVPLHPHVLSAAKLLVAPAMAAALLGPWPALRTPLVLCLVFLAFAVLDALDGIVARVRGLDSHLGRVLDRATDLPMLAVCLWAARDVIDARLLVAKLALDGVLLFAYVAKGASTENRVRTTMADATLLALLLLSLGERGVSEGLGSRAVVSAMLWLNIVFSAVVGLYNASLLQKRFIADALSASNALCGLLSIWFAVQQQPQVCLLLLLVGAGFDGLDGAAARRFGGTRFGVYSDDIADAINYAIAPGVAIAFRLSGVEGTVVGVLFTALTVSRLVFFTLNKKGGGDPAFFAGVPSTIGGVIALCALILFPDQHAIVGALVGVSVVLMVSFDSAYRHLGRALFSGVGSPTRRARTLLALACGLVLVVGSAVVGPRGPVAVVLGLCLVYGFLPQATRFASLLRPGGGKAPE